MRIDHVGLWVDDLERMREFYVRHFGGRSGSLYHNPRTGFRSYFIAFDGGARLELMHDGVAQGPSAETASGSSQAPAAEAASRRPQPPAVARGYAHLALAVGSRADVDRFVRALSAEGVVVASAPRTTGDGYYEAVALDPEGNRIEITAG